MFFVSKLFLTSLLVCLAHAYPEITSPAAGTSLPGGVAFTITWIDSGDAPALADLTSYQIFLYTGSNSNPQQIYEIGQGAFSAGNSITANVPVTIGGSTENAYFLSLVSTAAAGKTITSFSSRFTLTGMTGTFSPTVISELSKISGATGPPVVNNIAAPAAVADVAGAPLEEGEWAIPYNLQTGLTKYAPMQPIPPTAITATNIKPLWPTSSVELASTYLPTPIQVTTLTQSQTFSANSHANTGAAASNPADDMQRFLNRWKD
ncbi:BgTH12-06824 [Blumeria graminis f. sp. triticale]|uniref:BgTH12-06824 n=1 Tax=Blumeria graminis f. sp. triticale TaxID=1689686 RepID=A0A9W4DCG8_BLUGR|nr:BgTH12-06824 [Blumeria graminis f. sp. triticale]